MEVRARGGFDQQLMAVSTLEFFERRGRRAEDSDRTGPKVVQEITDLLREIPGLFATPIQHHHTGQRRERGVEHRLPEMHLTSVELFESMRGRELETVVIRKVALDHHFARSIATPGPPRDLGQQLKRSFGGAEIGQR